jgi:hypothetical protein
MHAYMLRHVYTCTLPNTCIFQTLTALSETNFARKRHRITESRCALLAHECQHLQQARGNWLINSFFLLQLYGTKIMPTEKTCMQQVARPKMEKWCIAFIFIQRA